MAAWLDDLVADLRFASRMLRKHPAFTATAVFMLAMGIGVNATVFSWLETIVLNPLPGVSDPATLVTVIQSDRNGVLLPLLSYPDFSDLRRSTDVFAGVVGTRSTAAVLERNGRSAWVNAAVASANMFDVLGIHAVEGRTFTAEEDAGEGGHPVVVLSDGLWRREFGGDPGVVGRSVRLNQRPFTVIGILPAAFRGVSGGSSVDLWAPLTMHEAVLNYGSFASRTFRWIQPLARLRSGTDAARASTALAVRSAELARSYPDSNDGIRYALFPLWKAPYGGQAAFLPALRVVFVMAVGILLIVIANIACLLLSRAASRQMEVAVRIAIGAGRARLIRQFLTESVALALIGGAIGLVIARWIVRLLPWIAPATAASFTYDFVVHRSTTVFGLVLSLATAILFGLAPAVTSSGFDVGASLKGGGRGTTADTRHGILAGLVVVEVALAITLIITAGLCLKGFGRAKQVDLGFEPGGVLYASFNLVPAGYSAGRAKVFDRTLRERLRAVPGVTGVAFVNTPPLGVNGTFTGTVDVEGHETRASDSRSLPFVIVSSGYLSVMRIALLEGRDFDELDDAARPAVAIVNDAMARRYWPGLNPVGRRFRMAVGIAPSEAFTVIGVAATSRYNSLAEQPTPAVYVTYLQRPIASLFMNVVVRSTGTAAQTISALRREVHAIDPAVEPLRTTAMSEYIQSAFLAVRTATVLLVALAIVAVLMAAAGLYAVMSYSVSERAREMGIRLALGASAQNAVWVVVRRGMALTLVGVAAGQLTSLISSRALARFLYGVSATDPLAFAGGTFLLIVVALIACGVPALRAAHVDPVTAMRGE